MLPILKSCLTRGGQLGPASKFLWSPFKHQASPSKLLGRTSKPLGSTSELQWRTSELLGNSSKLLGRTSKLLGSTLELLEGTFQLRICPFSKKSPTSNPNACFNLLTPSHAPTRLLLRSRQGPAP